MLVPRILSWNCRGAGSKAFLRHVSFLAMNYKPAILILLETRVNSSLIPTLLRKIHMSSYFVSEA